MMPIAIAAWPRQLKNSGRAPHVLTSVALFFLTLTELYFSGTAQSKTLENACTKFAVARKSETNRQRNIFLFEPFSRTVRITYATPTRSFSMRILLAASLALSLPLAAFAAGSEDSKPGKPHCSGGTVYDKKTNKCVDPNGFKIDTDQLYEQVRALSYDGQYESAQKLLAYMPAEDDRTLTYMGFTNRKMGNTDAAMTYYARALAVNPGNILARSYMGQGYVDDGNISAALEQLRAIRAHDGTGTWAEASLRTAIATGKTFNW